jgi:hypothetical protein
MDIFGSRECMQWRLGIKVSTRDTFLGRVNVGVVIAEYGGGFLYFFRFLWQGQQWYTCEDEANTCLFQTGFTVQIFCRIHCKPKIHCREFSLI